MTKSSAREWTARLQQLLGRERQILVELVLALADFDRQRGYLELGYSSLLGLRAPRPRPVRDHDVLSGPRRPVRPALPAGGGAVARGQTVHHDPGQSSSGRDRGQ